MTKNTLLQILTNQFEFQEKYKLFTPKELASQVIKIFIDSGIVKENKFDDFVNHLDDVCDYCDRSIAKGSTKCPFCDEKQKN